MRHAFALAIAASVTATATVVTSQSTDRMNPIIALQEKGLPVFGIAHPAIARGGRGRAGAAPDPSAPAPPPIVLADVAKETVDYRRADYLFTSGTSDTRRRSSSA